LKYYKKQHQKSFQQVHIGTANPEKLLIMCYDGLLKFLKTARLMMEKDKKTKADVYILKAVNVIFELIATLREDVDPDFAKNLKGLYVFILNRLRESTETGNMEGLDQSINIVNELKVTWEEALSKKNEEEAAQAPATGATNFQA